MFNPAYQNACTNCLVLVGELLCFNWFSSMFCTWTKFIMIIGFDVSEFVFETFRVRDFRSNCFDWVRGRLRTRVKMCSRDESESHVEMRTC